MSAWRALVLGAAGAVGGCSLLVSTDGLSTGTVVVIGEGGSSGGDGSSGGIGDGGITADGALVDAATGPFCNALSPKPKFCADFDDGVITDFGTVNGGPPTLESDVATSPPRALVASVSGDATDRSAKVVRDFPDSPAAIEVSFDVYVELYDVMHDVELVGVLFSRTGGKSCIVNVAIRHNAWTLDETCEGAGSANVDLAHPSAFLAKQLAWTHIDYAADFVSRSYSMSVDGQPAFSGVTLQPNVTTGRALLSMGISYLQTEATGGAKLRFDNVRFDYH